ncbi:hypothetical protein ATCV1_z496R [Acanthocystis turfacea chlorella virus 1]|uniref:Uncharacterized protein z496R n=1 Tax=Chlorovirus heliozoae TaxID=322019 RepID=A7K9A6_9PHYC|nr:hypothetical protein ATCV1_z496R [Acanthocystis turfacea chlorella virus 1]ABT16630.1 hypothetical protein ATCV1_z496R [Acanthocystis turfacea chlorella virus 1]
MTVFRDPIPREGAAAYPTMTLLFDTFDITFPERLPTMEFLCPSLPEYAPRIEFRSPLMICAELDPTTVLIFPELALQALLPSIVF